MTYRHPQKRLDEQTVLELAARGALDGEIARRFGVTRQAVNLTRRRREQRVQPTTHGRRAATAGANEWALEELGPGVRRAPILHDEDAQPL